MALILAVILASLWLLPGGLGAISGVPPPPPSGVPPAAPAAAGLSPFYRLPAPLYLCGEAVPLNEAAVKEELDREFTIVVWSRAQTTMWLKRAHRYFPDIEKKLRARLLPLDLKYVVLVESDLRLKAKSSAGAAGPWQFIAPTAQRFQLKCDGMVDERLEFGAATDAALNYLTRLHQLFNNWALALAAYNCGEARVQKALAAQGVHSFYHLSLPEETERYVPRILAAKIVLSDPAAYGYELPPDQLYQPLNFEEVTLSLTREVPVRRLAEACGTYYKAFKDLNPWIKGATLCAGTYRLKVPPGTGDRLLAANRQGQLGGK
jgi:membrane-bound lytic murein transglycosylase D